MAAQFFAQDAVVANVDGPIRFAEPIDGCEPFVLQSATGSVAVMQRGGCAFDTKVTNAQNAGAAAAVIIDTNDEMSPPGLGEGGKTIPVAMISKKDGAALLERKSEMSLQMSITMLQEDAQELLDTQPADIIRMNHRVECKVPGNNSFLDEQCQHYHRALPRTKPVKVFEGLMFNNEIDMLMLHLEEMYEW
jgi:hypothetical protein